MQIVNVKNLNHSEATKEQLLDMAKASGAEIEFTPSRRGNFEIMKVNGQAVAYCFEKEADAFSFFAERF